MRPDSQFVETMLGFVRFETSDLQLRHFADVKQPLAVLLEQEPALGQPGPRGAHIQSKISHYRQAQALRNSDRILASWQEVEWQHLIFVVAFPLLGLGLGRGLGRYF